MTETARAGHSVGLRKAALGAGAERAHGRAFRVERDDNIRCEALAPADLGHDLREDLGGDDVEAGPCAIVLPQKARADEVLVLDVEEVAGAPDIEHVSAPYMHT